MDALRLLKFHNRFLALSIGEINESLCFTTGKVPFLGN